MLNFKELMNLPKMGLFAFINVYDRKVDVRHTSNFLNAIERHITQIRLGIHDTKGLIEDKDKIEIHWLEEVNDPFLRKLKQSHWIKHFESEGYTNYRERTALEVKVKIREVQGLLHVILVNRNYDSITVGVFDSKQATDIFVQKYYIETPYSLVYAANELTKEFLEVDGYKDSGREIE